MLHTHVPPRGPFLPMAVGSFRKRNRTLLAQGALAQATQAILHSFVLRRDG